LAEDLVDARMDLRGISRQAIAHLAEIMLGGPAAPTLVALLANRSEGNPYFAEQIIRYLQEENFIEMSRDGWSLVRRLREDFLPGDIRSILVARLDQLTREVKLSIQTASILGREFELQVLLQMLRDDNAISYVDEAEKAAIWAPLNEIRYIFTHGLLRDAAYEMQMRARRQELHALAVDALESLYADDLKAHYAALAYHADHAYLSEKAQKYYMLAGKVAADLYQNSQGIDYFTRALTHTLPDDLRTQFEILTERVGLLNRMGERDSQLKDIDSLETLAQQIGDNRLLIQAKILHAQYCFTMGDYACTIEMSEEVAAKAKELGRAELALTVYVVWSQAHFRLGDLQESMTYATDGLNLARQAGKRLEEGRALSSMGLIALESKEPGKAQEYLEEAVVIAREIKDRTLESRAIANLANSAAYVQRDYMTARAYYEQANALNGELGDRYAQGIALGNIGWACGMLGDFAAAQKYHEQALLIAREIGNLYHETHILMNLSGVAEAQGKAQEAVQYALHANSLCKEKADKQSEAWSWLYLGYAYLADGELENARTAFEQALNLRRERGQHSLATEPAAGLIQVALRVDDLPLASRLTDEILSYLSADGTLEGAEEPARVYLACYSALERTGDSRASVLLDTAMHMLESQILKLNDEQARRMYIQNVPWRWAIEQTWLAKNKKSREPYPSQGRPD
jgi:tetratricopeptide (TPR) repeat protein